MTSRSTWPDAVAHERIDMPEQKMKDLSEIESRELVTFNEKRLWFESKLQLLERLPPISPFTDAGPSDLQAQNDQPDSPSRDITKLQDERDELEAEVLRFDDGDLLRMKEKTRTVTQSPLTPPSTELVSITLALIVVIDRLLSLLRERGELLELCQLYLEWRKHHTAALSRYTDLQVELEKVVSECRATLLGRINDKSGQRGAQSVTDPYADHAVSSDAHGSSHSPACLQIAMEDDLSALQAQLHTIGSYDVAHAAQTLDRMIDIGAALKATGALKAGKEAGAVPAAVLDKQDELENQGHQVAGLLDTCRRTMRSLTSVDDFLSRCDSALTEAELAIRNLSVNLNASPDRLERIRESRALLNEAEGTMPSRGGLAAVSDKLHLCLDDEQSQALIKVLHAKQREALRVLRECGAAIDWAQQYASARASLRKHFETLNTARDESLELLGQLGNDDESSTVAATEIIRIVQQFLANDDSAEHTKQVTITLMRFRATVKARPSILRELHSLDEDDCTIDEVDRLLDETRDLRNTLTSRLGEVCRAVERERTVADVTLWAEQAMTKATDLEIRMIEAIDRTLWPNANAPDAHEIASCADMLQVILGIDRELDNRTLSLDGLEINRHLGRRVISREEGIIEPIKRKIGRLKTHHSLLKQAQEQSLVIHAVCQEAEDFSMGLLQSAQDPTSRRALRAQIEDWEGGLAHRVPLLDRHPPSLSRSPQHGSSAYATALLTPPPSPPAARAHPLDSLDRWDLGAVDRAVRYAVNEQTARLGSMLESRPLIDKPELNVNPVIDGPPAPSQITSLSTPLTYQGLTPNASESREEANGKLHRPSTPRKSTMRAASQHEQRASVTAPVKSHTKPKKSTPQEYVPKVDNKLDQAVGQIVNSMKVNVPITPVHASVQQEWTDLSGSYWIGAEGRAKLCFCRILRSQTVMVRVGGGWVELSKFLADHFSEVITTPEKASPVSTNLTPDRDIGQSDPTHLSTPSRNASRASTRATSSTYPGLTRSSSSRHSLSLSANSPLSPLRFMRKASDSPEDRKKEKSQLKVGRRSILGKEP